MDYRISELKKELNIIIDFFILTGINLMQMIVKRCTSTHFTQSWRYFRDFHIESLETAFVEKIYFV